MGWDGGGYSGEGGGQREVKASIYICNNNYKFCRNFGTFSSQLVVLL